MFRLLGFLVGSLTSVLIILLIVGMPTFQLSDADANQERYDTAIDKLREKQKEFEDVAGRLTDDIARVAESVSESNNSISQRCCTARRGTSTPVTACGYAGGHRPGAR